MKNAKKALEPKKLSGYDYGTSKVGKSPISVEEFGLMKLSAGFSADERHWLRVAGEALGDQAKALVEKWREITAAYPHLAKYSLKPDGEKDAHYSEASGKRFEQWIVDTCLRPYDQDWLNYQQEIALRHSSVKKNKTDHADAPPTIPLRHIIAFTAVIIDPEIMKPLLSAKGHSVEDVEKMHRAWCKAVLLQIALWAQPYTDPQLAPNEW